MKHRRFYPLLWAFVIAWFGLAGLTSPDQAAPDEVPMTQQDGGAPAERPTDQIIVKYKESTGREPSQARITASPAEQAARLSQAAGVNLAFVREMAGGASVFRLPQAAAPAAVEALAAKIQALPEVEYAEPDRIMTVQMTPNDPYYGSQWHYFAPSAGNYGINLPAAWDITTGSPGTVVAVIDTGILASHPDLSGRTVQGYDFITDTWTANDGGGRDADPSDPGDWAADNECGSGYEGYNSTWHGTHVAGTIAGNTNNSLGVAGINWNAKILPVRVLGKCGGYTSDIVDGMRWAAGLSVSGAPANANPAQVLNLSLGGGGTCSSTYQTAINAIVAAGKTVVVAAGNTNTDATTFQPGNCSGVITVAATNRNGSRSYYSNYGSLVEVSAPGGELSYWDDPNGIRSTLNAGLTTPGTNNYVFYQGTSMAAPHVAGVVSLMYAVKPSLTPAEALAALQDTVTPFPAGSTCTTSNCGSGIINAAAALQSLSSDPPPSCTNLFQDPSFEAAVPPADNPYWVETSTNFGTPLCTTVYCGDGGGTALPRSGNGWSWFGGTASPETATLTQAVTIPSGGATLDFYFWLGSAAAGSGADDVFTARIDGATVFSANATQTGSYPGYTKISVDASSYANGASHTITFGSVTSGEVVNFNLDDVSLCSAATPIDFLTASKTASPTSVPQAGGLVNYTYAVTNHGAGAATITALSDNRFGLLAGDGDCYVGKALAAGASCSFTTAFTVPAGVYPGTHVNVFNAAASSLAGTDSASDDAVVSYSAPPTVNMLYLPLTQYAREYSGKVTYKGKAAANKTIKMWYTTNNWSSSSVYATTVTDAAGNYSFAAPKVGSGYEFFVQWANPDASYAMPYLASWSCTDVQGVSTDKWTCNFDIQDVVLSKPAHKATVSLPYTFSWYRRTTTSDSYEVDWWDPDLGHYMWTNKLGYASSFKLYSIPSFYYLGFPYNWSVYVWGSNGLGVPYYYRWVTFNNRGAISSTGLSSAMEALSASAQDDPRALLFGSRIDDLPQPRPVTGGEKPR